MESIGTRMKVNYESVTDIRLIRRTPVIIRVDGKCCHSLKLQKPFDAVFIRNMKEAAASVALNMQSFKLAYVQSDEASFLLTDFDSLQTEPWFGYELRKIISISASMFTLAFNYKDDWLQLHPPVTFDCRAFNIPREEVTNYFLWRAQDWGRNSIQMLAQTHFSPKQLHGKNGSAMHEMLHGIGINWADLSDVEKNGTWILKDGSIHHDIKPKFAEIDAVVAPWMKDE